MADRRDVREKGVTAGTHSAMTDALERRRRENEEVAQRRRAHQRLYEAQFRRPSRGPIDKKASLRATQRWLDNAFGRLREKPRKVSLLPPLHEDLTPEQVFRGPEDRECKVLPLREVMPPKKPVEIAPWVLDAETLETAYALDDMTLPTWSINPYSNLWTSVGLILNDTDFQHVRIVHLDIFSLNYNHLLNPINRIYSISS